MVGISRPNRDEAYGPADNLAQVWMLGGRVPDGGVASRSRQDAGVGRAGQAAKAGRLTMGSSLIADSDSFRPGIPI